jgi:hypothetical protein
MTAITLYPCRIRLTGHPAQHGLADLGLTLDTNDPHETHIVVTMDQLLDLHEQITRKLSELPFHLANRWPEVDRTDRDWPVS